MAANGSLGDLGAVLAFALLGVFMKRYGWPRPPILIAVALADVLERFLRISVNNCGWAMLLRPQFLAILGFMVVVTLFSLRAQRGARRAMGSMSGSGEGEAGSARREGAPAVQDAAGVVDRGHAPDSAARRRAVGFTARGAKAVAAPARFHLSLEVAGEALLLLAVGAFFTYMFVELFRWPEGARSCPGSPS